MNKAFATIEDIREEIERNDLFDFQFIPEESKELSECISSIAFGHDRKEVYITCLDWSKQNVINYKNEESTVSLITKELVNKGYKILLCDRTGKITCVFEFEECHLKDKAEIKLDYNIGSKIPMYVISLSYKNIYKLT